ncbi:MerR family transcriptional regulator [Litoribrevibacter albus]|nr:MerR family transcriptional regulator [Litoribrevibacter albus]
MYRIGQLVKDFGLSRSTLLYYDRIGLLKSQIRTGANYRIYSEADYHRLGKICTYKQAGISLEDIKSLLDTSECNITNVLEKRLESLNSEISELRKQQQVVVSLLGKDSLLRSTKTMSKEQWVDILKASGMTEEDMHRWHVAFERSLPEAHTDFLESLGIDNAEIARIKQWSKP